MDSCPHQTPTRPTSGPDLQAGRNVKWVETLPAPDEHGVKGIHLVAEPSSANGDGYWVCASFGGYNGPTFHRCPTSKAVRRRPRRAQSLCAPPPAPSTANGISPFQSNACIGGIGLIFGPSRAMTLGVTAAERIHSPHPRAIISSHIPRATRPVVL